MGRPPYDTQQKLEEAIVHVGEDGSAEGYPVENAEFRPEGHGAVLGDVPSGFPIFGTNTVVPVRLTWRLMNYTWSAPALLATNSIREQIQFTLTEEPEA